MNKLFYVRAIISDSFEDTASYLKRTVVAADKEAARDIVAKQLEEDIKEANAPCATYEITRIDFIRDMN